MAINSWLTCANIEQNSGDALRAMSSRVDKPKTTCAKQPLVSHLRHVRPIMTTALTYQQAKRFLNAQLRRQTRATV